MEKTFWSRGNGWPLGSLVRVLENMPADYPDHFKFEKLYQDMIGRIASFLLAGIEMYHYFRKYSRNGK